MITLSHRSRFSILLILLILLSTIGCDEFGLLENMNTDPAVRVALENGGFSPGDNIDLWVEYEDNPPDGITARLDQGGESILNLEIVPPVDGWGTQTGSTGELHIPSEVPEGRYVLVTEAWSGGKILSQQRTNSYVIMGDWRIAGMESFPPQGVPGGVFFARAALDIPDNSDPWLQWLLEDEIIAEGFYSEGWDEVVFEAADRPGMSSLVVELHPDRPESEEIPIQLMQTELYILPAQVTAGDGREPSDSYSILLQFDGTLGNEPRPEIVGKPRPVVIGDDKGFRLSGGAGLRWQNLPSEVINLGTAEPFSLTFGFLPESGGEGRILSIGDEGDFSLVVSRLAPNSLSLMVNGDSNYSSTFTVPDTGGSPLNVTISFQPEDSGLAIVWKIDGDTYFIDYWNTIPAVYGDSLDISLGAEGGFGGVLTKFGIHVRDAAGNPAPEADLFSFYQDRENLMLIAEGFEDRDIAAEIDADSEVFIENGSLILPPDSSIRFPGGGKGHLAVGGISDEAELWLSLVDPVSREIQESIPVNDDFYGDSPYRFSIMLEKINSMSDNEIEAVYELRASSQNESNLRLEHILVDRE